MKVPGLVSPEESNTLQRQPHHRRGPSRLQFTRKHRAPAAHIPPRSCKPTGLWTDYSANFCCSFDFFIQNNSFTQKARGCWHTTPEDCFTTTAFEPFWLLKQTQRDKTLVTTSENDFPSPDCLDLLIVLKKSGCSSRLKIWLKIAKTTSGL